MKPIENNRAKLRNSKKRYHSIENENGSYCIFVPITVTHVILEN